MQVSRVQALPVGESGQLVVTGVALTTCRARTRATALCGYAILPALTGVLIILMVEVSHRGLLGVGA